MATIPVESTTPLTPTWMTLSPIDGVKMEGAKARGVMCTVIENSKKSDTLDTLASKVDDKGSAVVATIQEVQPASYADLQVEKVLGLQHSGIKTPEMVDTVAEPEYLQPAVDQTSCLKPDMSEALAREHAPKAAFPTYLPASTRLQNMLKDTTKLIVCPGVYDGLSARTALEVGFDALYMTGAGTSCSRLGMADLGLASLHDMRAQAEMICNLVPWGAPVIADMDGGYGGPMMIDRAVREYVRAGVAGFHIEDQLIQKRCGHLKGKQVVPREEYYSRIRAAKAAKERVNSDIVLIARTDALQALGYDECMERLKVARDLGADVGLLEGFSSRDMAARCAKELAPWPLLMNSVENGASPLITVDEAREMGFRIMIFSFASLTPAYLGIKATLETLKLTGQLGAPKFVTPRKLFEVCGLEELMQVDTHAGGTAFAAGV
ncbi:MAG: hypothetical protein Q9162_005847 [Coniocarpon cinnabarinum]